MDFEQMKHAIERQDRVVSLHAADEAAADNLDPDDVWASIVFNGEVIEDYPDAKRGPCCLILSWLFGQPVHTVVAYPARRNIAFMITVYRPDEQPHEWSPDFRKRL